MTKKTTQQKRPFTDRESGTYAGLMLTLRKHRNRLEPHPGYELNKKPRKIDILIIDRNDSEPITDNVIARIFTRHNIVELKGPREALSINTIWKVISYAAQYRSELDPKEHIENSDITITLLRAAKPRKVLTELTSAGHTVSNPYPGIYYITGMVPFKMQIVVTSELVGDDYVPLRIQKKGAKNEDYLLFADNIKHMYSADETSYVESVIRYGIYDEKNEIIELAEEDHLMYDQLMELFKDDIDKKCAEARAEGEARGKAIGQAEGEAIGQAKGESIGREARKKLEERIKYLEHLLEQAGTAPLYRSHRFPANPPIAPALCPQRCRRQSAMNSPVPA